MTGAVVDEFDGLRLLCDPEGVDRPDVVQGATQAARMLAGLLVRRRARTALDLGTGCGVLAFALARHAERVVATDVNPRALELGRRAAQLNGITNVEWRLGDWYEPVRGERFDLIACNPPYVISPETRLVFRDGADATEGVVRGAGARLRPGGLAHFLLNWAHAGDDWASPLAPWLPDGCDALVVHHASMRPRQYAETWVAPGPRRDADVARWLRWYRERGIEAIGAGFLLLRRRDDDGAPRMHALEAETAATPRAGIHVERILRGTDLAASDDGELLRRRLRVVDGTRVEQTTRRRAGGWSPGEARLRIVPTVGVEATVPAAVVPVVWALDGSRPVGEALAGVDPGEGFPVVRRLLETGFLEPA